MAVDTDPGVGVGTPIAPGIPGAVPAHPDLNNIIGAMGDFNCLDLAVPLPMYAQVIGYDECAFFGVIRDDPPSVHMNRPLWIKSERDLVEQYLAEAQYEIEQVTHFPLKHTWFADEEHDFDDPLQTKWTKVIEVGIQASVYIDEGTAVNHATDPATVGPLATTVTDEEEVYVFHTGTCTRIYPSNIDITGGQLTIEIPRCRLLTEEAYAEGSIDYDDIGAGGSFELDVDVAQIYNDDSTQGELVWTHGTGTCPNCAGTTSDGCLVITDGEIGEMDIIPATYSGGSWTRSSVSCLCCLPDRVRLNYHAGLESLTLQARDAIMRLAHAKMPYKPCNTDPPLWTWEADRFIPPALTRARLDNPFGLQEGAWQAYRFARAMKVIRGYSL